MRELHAFSDERTARRMTHVLQARSMPASLEQEGDTWVVWIQNDDHRGSAQKLLAEFQANPEASEFVAAEQVVKQKIVDARREAKARQRLMINIQDRWAGVWYRCYPATMILIAISVFVALICTDWQSGNTSGWRGPATCNNEHSEIRNALFIQAPSRFISIEGREYAVFEEPQLATILKSGQIWRIFTPMFLHFGVLHILFNMMWLRDLGTGIEYVRGTRRFLMLVLICAGTSNIAQMYWSGAEFGGMSGVVFGLIGYVWMKGKTQPHLGLGLLPDQVVYSILWMFLCIGGALGPVANAAHVVGMAAGILIGARQAIWKKLITFFRQVPGSPQS